MAMKKLMVTVKPSHLLIYAASALWAIPFVWVVYTALRPKGQALGRMTFDFTMDNLRWVWNGAPFTLYFANTVIIAFGIFAVQMATSTMAAFAFAKIRFWGSQVVFLLFLIQIMIPADVLILPNYLILRDFSLLDTKIGIMLPYFASALGIFLLRQFFKTIPHELDEAAALEGYSKWRIMWKIYLPLSRSAYVSFALVSISYHWNNFMWPLIVTNSVENRPLTVGLAMFAKAGDTGAQWSEMTAATLIVVLPLFVVFLLFQRQFMNSFMQSGIK